MLKSELIREFAKKGGLTLEKSGQLLNVLQEVIVETAQKGEDLVFMDLGVFQTKDTAERKCSNPQTKEEIIIPAGRKTAFKTRKLLKDLHK